MLYVAADMSLGKVSVVLHRPSSAENVGAAARVLKNFGLAALAVVTPPAWEGAPRSGGEGTAREDVLRRAGRLARHAGDVLAGASFHVDLDGALAGTTWACGTSSRAIDGRPRLTPRELAAEAVRRAAAGGQVAVVFGEERRGLSDAELERCQAVCTIPTASAYDSMNLAQAVAVVAYELALAAGAGLAPAERPPAARRATVEALWARLSALLGAAGYLNPQNPEQILAEWRRLLDRAEPTQREVELLLAGAKALERRLGVAAGPSGEAASEP